MMMLEQPIQIVLKVRLLLFSRNTLFKPIVIQFYTLIKVLTKVLTMKLNEIRPLFYYVVLFKLRIITRYFYSQEHIECIIESVIEIVYF
jgi:hypothetical protein